MNNVNISDEKTHKEEKDVKKIFTTLLCVFLIGGFGVSNIKAFTPAKLVDNTLTPEDLTSGEENRATEQRWLSSDIIQQDELLYGDIEAYIENHAISIYENTGQMITWAITSLNNHTATQYHIFDGNGDSYEKIVDTIEQSNYDFVQIETIVYNELSVDIDNLDLKQINTYLNWIFPDDRLYKQLFSEDIPVNIEASEINKDVILLKVAVGKYVIRPGDTLSEIALKYDTSVEKLLQKNKNIEDENLIYAGDYLLINK